MSSDENGAPTPEAEEDRIPDSVELRGRDGVLKVRFFRPKLGRRHEIAYAVVKSDIKAGCAALGLSSKTIQKHIAFDHDVLGFGDRVLEWLLDQGVPYLEIRDAAFMAYNYVTDGLLDTAEVDAVEGFTEAEGASTS